MTANIKVVTDQRESVLQVPNAALRFRPPGVEADSPRNPSEAPRGPAATAESRPGDDRRAPSEARPGGGNRAAADGAPRRGAGQPGRVWMIGGDGKPRAVAVQLGISDGTRSEVLAGPLTEQSQVIVSTGGPGDHNSRSGSEPRLRF
jgi:HlyD family secretion protein